MINMNNAVLQKKNFKSKVCVSAAKMVRGVHALLRYIIKLPNLAKGELLNKEHLGPSLELWVGLGPRGGSPLDSGVITS